MLIQVSTTSQTLLMLLDLLMQRMATLICTLFPPALLDQPWAVFSNKQKKTTPPSKPNKKSHHTSHHTPVTWRLWPSPPDLHNYAPFLSSLLFHFLSLSLHFLSCLSIQVSRVRDISGHPNIPICPGSRWHSGHYTWQQQSLTHLAACHQRGSRWLPDTALLGIWVVTGTTRCTLGSCQARSQTPHTCTAPFLLGSAFNALDENSDLAVTQLSLRLFFTYLPSLTVIQTQELLEWCAMSKTPRLKTAPKITHLHKKYLARDE